MGLLDEFFGDQKADERKSCFKDLIAVMCVDGVLDSKEKQLLLVQGQKLGLNQNEMEQVLANPAAVKFTPPKDTRRKVEHLLDLVVMMMVDGKIDQREKALCRKIAVAMGAPPMIIDKMVADIVSGMRQAMPKQQQVKTIEHWFTK